MPVDRPSARSAAWLGQGPLWTLGMPLCVLGVALALRLHGLGAKPLWNDEAWSILISRNGMAATIDAVRHDFHPPGYYLALNAWMKLGGGAAWARLLSAVLGSVAALLIYVAGRLLGGPLLGLAAGLFLATAPLHLEWSQVARGYATLDFAVALALLGAVRLLVRRPDQSPPAWGWVAYIAGGAIALWIHNLAGFFLVSINLAALAEWVFGLRCERRFAIQWIAAQLAIVGLFLPWVPSLLVQMHHVDTEKSHHFLLSSWQSYRDDIVGMFGIARLWSLAVPAFVVTALLAVWGMAARRLVAGGTLVVCITVLAPVLISAALFAAGFALFGVVIGKIVWLGVPYSLAVGAGALAIEQCCLRRRWMFAVSGLLLAALLLVMQAQGVRNVYASPNPAWDEAARTTAQEVKPGDVVMEAPLEPALSYTYYCDTLGLSLPHVYPGAGVTDLAAWLKAQGRVWVPVPEPPENNRVPEAVAAARRAGLSVRAWSFHAAHLYLMTAAPEEGANK